MGTVVVGGGPAGLGAAYRLVYRHRRPVLVLEAAPVFGGLAAGFRHGPFTLDFGPHRLHRETDPIVMADLHALLGGDLQLRRRRGRIWLNGRYLPFPVGPATLLQLGPVQAGQFAAGVLGARLRRNGQGESYASTLTSRLGEPLYQLFYGPYAEKVWGLPGTEIAADQAEKRVNQRGLGDLVRLALGRSASKHYWYPRKGFGQIPAAYEWALRATQRAELYACAAVETVHWQAGRITGIAFRQEGALREAAVDDLIWTAPVTELIRRLTPAPPPALLERVRSLRYRAVVLCYAVLDVDRVGDADTYYFPDREIPFNRVIEQKNFSAELAPPNATVLGMDLACNPDDALFQANDDELRRLTLSALERAGLLQRGRVVDFFSRRFRTAYPVYDLCYQAALSEVQGWLEGFQNLWLAGRHGLFLHNNTHHSLLMGYRAADEIAAGGDRARWRAALAEFATFRVAD